MILREKERGIISEAGEMRRGKRVGNRGAQADHSRECFGKPKKIEPNWVRRGKRSA